MGWREAIAALVGVSAYERPPSTMNGPELDDPSIERLRENNGGNLAMMPTTRTRWYLTDVERAAHQADVGDISEAARLCRSMRRDGVIAGLMGTLTSGIVRMPKRYYGDPEIVDTLKSRNGTRSVFEDMFPPAELSLLAADGHELGIGVAELVPVTGRDFPIMIRLEPEFLRYRWSENRWYYISVAGPIPIVPGDGRWILHMPGGRISPWLSGLWHALARAFVQKEHALMHRANYGAKLANAARVAVSPQGASEQQKQSWFQAVMAWGVNTVFGMTPGYDVKLLESNGRGYEVFQAEIDNSNNEIMVAIAGQVVTVEGGAGFSNADVHRAIRADIIKSVAESLAYTLNTQGLPAYVVQRWGIDALRTGATVEWDIDQPKDKNAEASAMVSVSTAITQLTQALAPYGKSLAIDELTTRFGIPLSGAEDGDPLDIVVSPEPAVLQ